MGVLKTQKFCIQCHSDYNVGDVRGGIRVHLPMDTFKENINSIEDKNDMFKMLTGVFALLFYIVVVFFLEKNEKKQKMLMQSQANLLRAQRITHIGNWERDFKNDTLEWSQELYRIFGLNEKESSIDCKIYYKMVHPDDLGLLKKGVKEILKSKKPGKVQYRIVLPNGDIRHVEKLCEVVLDEKGEVLKTFGTIQDITKRKVAEIALKDQEEIMIAQSRHAAMGEMISMIAHQWRQPLSVISMTANNVLTDIELDMVDNETLKENADEIVAHTQDLSKTIDDFKNFFRPVKTVEEVYLREVFDDAFNVVGKSLENNSIETVKDFENDTRIKTYSRELMQVLINIIKNAKEAIVEHTKENRKIMISI